MVADIGTVSRSAVNSLLRVWFECGSRLEYGDQHSQGGESGPGVGNVSRWRERWRRMGC